MQGDRTRASGGYMHTASRVGLVHPAVRAVGCRKAEAPSGPCGRQACPPPDAQRLTSKDDATLDDAGGDGEGSGERPSVSHAGGVQEADRPGSAGAAEAAADGPAAGAPDHAREAPALSAAGAPPANQSGLPQSHSWAHLSARGWKAWPGRRAARGSEVGRVAAARRPGGPRCRGAGCNTREDAGKSRGGVDVVGWSWFRGGGARSGRPVGDGAGPAGAWSGRAPPPRAWAASGRAAAPVVPWWLRCASEPGS
jgi:hypothetical protein